MLRNDHKAALVFISSLGTLLSLHIVTVNTPASLNTAYDELLPEVNCHIYLDKELICKATKGSLVVLELIFVLGCDFSDRNNTHREVEQVVQCCVTRTTYISNKQVSNSLV